MFLAMAKARVQENRIKDAVQLILIYNFEDKFDLKMIMTKLVS